MTNQQAGLLAMRAGEPARMNPIPQLVFEQTAGDQLLLPQGRGWRAILRQQVGQGDRRIEIDHRSSRSCRSSSINVRKAATGLRGGMVPPPSAGGVTQPRRTASASLASP